MRSLGTRRAALVAGAATVAALALGGCSAGQVTGTAMINTPIVGVNAESANGSVLVRNLQVEYNGVEGYEAGESAPLELSLFNESSETVTVTISPRPADRPQVVTGTRIGLVSSATVTTPGEPASASAEAEPAGDPSASAPAQAEPSGAPSASAPAEAGTSVQPAQIKLAPHGSALFRPTDASQLQIIGLTGELTPGMAVSLAFEFSNDTTPLVVQAPVASPLTPAPRGSGEAPEEHLGEAEHE